MDYEIELKAHVYNRQEVIEILNKIAVYGGHTEKDDFYYRFELPPKAAERIGKPFISARIRHELLTNGKETTTKNIFTYKKKEIKQNSDGTSIEVNEENEFSVSDSHSLLTFISDLGAELAFTKQKSVEQWIMQTQKHSAHIELCTVPPLGDFLEIEIIENKNDEKTVNECKQEIQEIFKACNIPLDQIEERYYKDMINEKNSPSAC